MGSWEHFQHEGWVFRATLCRGGSRADLTTGWPCADRDRTKVHLPLHGVVSIHPRGETSILTTGPAASFILR